VLGQPDSRVSPLFSRTDLGSRIMKRQSAVSEPPSRTFLLLCAVACVLCGFILMAGCTASSNNSSASSTSLHTLSDTPPAGDRAPNTSQDMDTSHGGAALNLTPPSGTPPAGMPENGFGPNGTPPADAPQGRDPRVNGTFPAGNPPPDGSRMDGAAPNGTPPAGMPEIGNRTASERGSAPAR
jgi:hypothetical protein